MSVELQIRLVSMTLAQVTCQALGGSGAWNTLLPDGKRYFWPGGSLGTGQFGEPQGMTPPGYVPFSLPKVSMSGSLF